MKTYEVYYRGELIAEVIDYGKGFEAIVEDLSECEIVDTHGIVSCSDVPIVVNQAVDVVHGTFTGVTIDRIG